MNIFNKYKILFIQPKHGMTYMDMKKFGYNVEPPYNDNNIVLRLLREVWFRLHIPGKSIWYNKFVNKNYDVYVVFDPLIIGDYIRWLKKHNQTSRIIFLYNNPVKNDKSFYQIPEDCCEKWTWNEIDCEKYGMKYIVGTYFSQHKIKKEDPVYDIFYIARDKGRASFIFDLEKEFKKLDLKSYIHISADRRYQRFNKSYYKPLIPYKEVTNILKKSKSILDITQEGQTGPTLRVLESLFNEIKLITNNVNIYNYDFYRKENIFILGKDDLDDLQEFINSPYMKIDDDIVFKYEFGKTWECIFK